MKRKLSRKQKLSEMGRLECVDFTMKNSSRRVHLPLATWCPLPKPDPGLPTLKAQVLTMATIQQLGERRYLVENIGEDGLVKAAVVGMEV